MGLFLRQLISKTYLRKMGVGEGGQGGAVFEMCKSFCLVTFLISLGRGQKPNRGQLLHVVLFIDINLLYAWQSVYLIDRKAILHFAN